MAAAAAAALEQAITDAAKKVAALHVAAEKKTRKALSQSTADAVEALVRGHGVVPPMRVGIYDGLKKAPLTGKQPAAMTFRSPQGANNIVSNAFKCVIRKLAAETVPDEPLDETWVTWITSMLTTSSTAAKAWQQHHGAFPAQLTPEGWAASFQAIFDYGAANNAVPAAVNQANAAPPAAVNQANAAPPAAVVNADIMPAPAAVAAKPAAAAEPPAKKTMKNKTNTNAPPPAAATATAAAPHKRALRAFSTKVVITIMDSDDEGNNDDADAEETAEQARMRSLRQAIKANPDCINAILRNATLFLDDFLFSKVIQV